LNTKRPTVVFFLGPTRPLQSYDKKGPTSVTVLVTSREMTRTAVVAVGRRGKDDRKQNTLALLEKTFKLLEGKPCLDTVIIMLTYTVLLTEELNLCSRYIYTVG
jgi:hypothetical protein